MEVQWCGTVLCDGPVSLSPRSQASPTLNQVSGGPSLLRLVIFQHVDISLLVSPLFLWWTWIAPVLWLQPFCLLAVVNNAVMIIRIQVCLSPYSQFCWAHTEELNKTELLRQNFLPAMAKSQPQEGNMQSSTRAKTKADFLASPPMTTSQKTIARRLAQGRAKLGSTSAGISLLKLEIVIGFTIYWRAHALGLRHLKKLWNWYAIEI